MQEAYHNLSIKPLPTHTFIPLTICSQCSTNDPTSESVSQTLTFGFHSTPALPIGTAIADPTSHLLQQTAEAGSMATAVIYQEVKAWIAQQEAFEAQHNKPAPLTDVQRMALQALRLPIANPSPPTPPPPTNAAAVGGPNYVGLLMGMACSTPSPAKLKLTNHTEYHQKRDQLSGLQWIEEISGSLPGGVTGRICRVTIVESLAHESGHIEYFPAIDYGLNVDGSEPRFPSKKAAKHFAAKCAVEWLVAQGFMPFPHLHQSISPSPTAHSKTAMLATPGNLKRAAQGANSPTPPPPPKRLIMTDPEGLDGTSEPATARPPSPPRATELVNALCHELGISSPKYDLVLTAPNTYGGRALFDDYGDQELLSLADASVVKDIVGKDNTRQAIAAKVLEKLREIEAVRDAQLQLLTARLASEHVGAFSKE